MELLINVNNQKLKIATNLKTLVAGSQQFIKLIFNLSDEWDNLTVFAQFVQDENSYNVFLDENNSVYLPHEIQAGTCRVLLYGTGSQGQNSHVIATTNFLQLNIDENIIVADANSIEISESLYGQLIEKFRRIIQSNSTPIFVNGVGNMINHDSLYVNTATSTVYQWSGTAWINTGVTYGTGESMVISGQFINLSNYQTYGITTLTDFKKNTIYGISNGITSNEISGLPVYGKMCTLITMAPITSNSNGLTAYLMYVYDSSTVDVYYNAANSSGTTIGWNKLNPDPLDTDIISGTLIINQDNYVSNQISDLIDFQRNRVYGIWSNITESMITNLPVYGTYKVLFVMSPKTSTNHALNCYFLFNITSAGVDLYYNSSTTSGTLLGWKKVNTIEGLQKLKNISNLIEKYDDIFLSKKVVFVGDGWLTGQGMGDYNSNANLRLIVPATEGVSNSNIYAHDECETSSVAKLCKYLRDKYGCDCYNNGINGYTYKRLYTQRDYVFKIPTQGDEYISYTNIWTNKTIDDSGTITPDNTKLLSFQISVSANSQYRLTINTFTDYNLRASIVYFNGTTFLSKTTFSQIYNYNNNTPIIFNTPNNCNRIRIIVEDDDAGHATISTDLINIVELDGCNTNRYADIAVIWLGINNRVKNSTTDYTGEIPAYLNLIVKYCQSKNITPIIVTNGNDNRPNSETMPISCQAVANQIKTACYNSGIDCYDFNSLITFFLAARGIDYNNAVLYIGNTHPNEVFHGYIYETLKYLLKV